MDANHPVDPLEAARTIVRASYEAELAADRNMARVVQTVRACVSRYGNAFPVAARIRSLGRRDR
jgi:hypothetical protein